MMMAPPPPPPFVLAVLYCTDKAHVPDVLEQFTSRWRWTEFNAQRSASITALFRYHVVNSVSHCVHSIDYKNKKKNGK